MSAPSDPRRAIRRLNVFGLAILFALVGGVGGWAFTTELAGAVIASGRGGRRFRHQAGAAPDWRRGG